MYSRSERKFLEPHKSTNPNLGPGSYTIDETLITPKPIKRSTTPFSNVSDRKTIFDDLAKSAAPPPGAYNIELFDIQKTVKSVSFGKSNINRFEQLRSSTPGPGAYYNSEFSSLRPHTHDGRLTIPESGINVQSIMAKPSTADPTLFSVQASKKLKIIWKRKHLPPSIPYRLHSNGYVENEDGDIVPREVEKIDNSIGPAYYDIQTSLPYKQRNGTDFSKSRTERCIIKSSSSPGPGTYDVAKASKALLDNKAVNESTPSTPTMRFGDIVMNEAAKHNLPGPGSYAVSSMLNNKNKGASFGKCVGRIENASTNPFGIVKTLQDDNPGPGTYNGPSESKQRKATRLTPQPFNSSAKRFTGFKSNTANNLPAPNSYNPGDVTVYGPKKPLRRSKSYAFGLKSERFHYSKNSENTSPGPAFYDNHIKRSSSESKPKNRYRKSARPYNNESHSLQPTPAFGTQTSRFLEGREKETPPPNAYDVLHVYDALQSKGKVAAIRRTASAPSLSNKSGNNLTAAASNTPGPGAYDPLLFPRHKNIATSAFVSKNPRFVEKLTELPGPSLPHTDLVKKSFNTTIEGEHHPLHGERMKSRPKTVKSKGKFKVEPELPGKLKDNVVWVTDMLKAAKPQVNARVSQKGNGVLAVIDLSS